MAILRQILSALGKIPTWAIYAIYAGFMGFNYYSMYYTDTSPLADRNRALAATQAETDRLNLKLKEIDTFMKGLEAKRKEVRDLAQKLSDTKAVLNEAIDMPALTETANNEAKKSGIAVSSFAPGRITPRDFYGEQTLKISFKGTYKQILLFFARLTKLPVILRIDDFSFRTTASAKGSAWALLEGSATLKDFYYIRSKADDVVDGGSSK